MEGGTRARKYEMHSYDFQIGNILIFFNAVVEKNNPEPWIYSFLYQFHAEKALFKVPKNCNINF